MSCVMNSLPDMPIYDANSWFITFCRRRLHHWRQVIGSGTFIADAREALGQRHDAGGPRLVSGI